MEMIVECPNLTNAMHLPFRLVVCHRMISQTRHNLSRPQISAEKL